MLNINCPKNRINILSITIIVITFFAFISGEVCANEVVINEILPHPSSGSDWIELFKTQDSTLDLSNWKIEDSTSEVKVLLEGTKIASDSPFLVIPVSNRLNNSGDIIKLSNQNGVEIDVKGYDKDPGVDVSIGRYPDGSGSWGLLTSSSQGTSNSDFIPSITPSPSKEPTSKPTSKPTSTPKPTETIPTKSLSTIKPSYAKKISLKKISPTTNIEFKAKYKDSDNSYNVLGEEINSSSSAGQLKRSSGENKISPNAILILLLSGGVFSIGASVYLSFKQVKKRRRKIV